jgi:1-acyl-sn-glycerol-3-phosphate acyltransferase
MRQVRAALYLVWFYLSLAGIGLLGMPYALTSPRATLRVMQAWAAAQWWALRVFGGVRIEYRGFDTVPAGATLVAMKHHGTFETIATFAMFPDPCFVIKQELARTPVFGWYCQQGKFISIDRDGGAKTMKKMLAEARAAVDAKRQVVIFPEGTRQAVGAPADYKPGVAGLYRAMGVPCVPVALNTGLVWSGSLYGGRPGKVIFEALPAIPPGLSRDAFMARLEAELEPATARLVAEGREGAP